ncbi:RNA polymerase sigma factor [Pseudonocardia endophytica]|uniref:RNA polymerase sigma factor n=1 Tax=Pseudonocardia endophytica TaxID=401976 RepID=UPI001FB438DD|nr:RNA polymerase sigma factor [Pseudonocardia endophytica]
MAERHGADDDRDVGRPAYDPAYYGDPGWDDERDPYRDPVSDGFERTLLDSGGVHLEPEPPSGAVVAQHRVVPHGELRADFGAHLETHYPRLVAQLYAITLHPGDAHEAVQDAYSRAWRRWADLRDTDVVGWIRRVAIRTSMRGWRPGLTRAGLRRNRLPAAESLDPQTGALLEALAGLPVAVRRAVVLRHMVGLGEAEIAELERVGEPVVRERLRRGRDAVHDGMDEMLGRVVDAAGAPEHGHRRGGRHGRRGDQG